MVPLTGIRKTERKICSRGKTRVLFLYVNLQFLLYFKVKLLNMYLSISHRYPWETSELQIKLGDFHHTVNIYCHGTR